ncbi:MAG: RluA family pseudouridine synthase [Candidatus Pacebacteria bacterium]|jgi:23S rRNA pseudouridine1911/1915/1917 synthase|nr:RluA family pseudouridine synthase [Candidatus Paceibacterota bacterium]
MEIIYEDENVKVLDKPAGIDSETIPGRAHRLDKDTSGVLITAKDEKTLDFLQKQFKERKTEKAYTALVIGNIKNKKGIIETLLGRSPQDRRKQKVFLPHEPEALGKRDAATEYSVMESFKDYDLVEAKPRTGRKHQIRVHMAYLGHPIAGDKLYGFKNQPVPEGLERQFLHASRLRIQLPEGEIKEFYSPLPKDLKTCLQKLKTS